LVDPLEQSVRYSAVGVIVIHWDWGFLLTQCLREAQVVLGSTGTAEDAAQEAAVRAWRRRETCLTPERPGPWVATIARNEALRLARPSRAEPLEEATVIAEESHEEHVLGQADIERAIARLSGPDRELVRGRYWEDLDYRQLGRLLHISEGTARVRVHRALATMREALAET
jgi:RNA polymerase sigma-70 factor, ECF subfamily